MNPESGFPPSHRKVHFERTLDGLQPEVCDLCGLLVGGAHLFTITLGPLSGRSVCDVTKSCLRYRPIPKSVLRDIHGHEDWHTDSRYFETGAPRWWDPDDLEFF
jgi:hypothetical protein